MKVKLNLDKDQIKKFFILHGEKVGFGLFALLFVLLCWSAYGLELYKRTPQELQATTENLQQSIAQARFDPRTIAVADYPKMFQEDAAKALPELYRTSMPMNPPVFDFKVRRGEPAYLPLVELLADADFGPLALTNDGQQAGVAAAPPPPAHAAGAQVPAAVGPQPIFAPQGARQSGRRWIALRGLVPVGAQRAVYTEMFEKALFRSLRLDTPYYEFFEIQRAEVKSGSAEMPAAQEWQTLPLTKQTWDAEVATWAVDVPERVDAQFISLEDYMCQPIPPVLGKVLPAEVAAHPPKIPSNDGNVAAGPAAAPLPAAPAGGRGRRAPQGPDVGAPKLPEGAAAQPQVAAKDKVEFRLFRYFDFNVEPGKTYRYRVKLLLANPNQGVETRYLKDPKLAEGPERATAWSNVTPPVFVRRDAEIFAGEVIPARSTSEPKAIVAIRRFEAQSGDTVADIVGDQDLDKKRDRRATRFDFVFRGAVLDFKRQVNSKSIELRTDAVLVDLSGEEVLDPSARNSVRAPAELLILGPDGELVAQSAFTDGDAFRAERARADKATGGDTKGPDNATPTAPAADPFGGIFDLSPKKK